MDSRISTSLPDVTSIASAPRPTAAPPSVPFSDVLAGTVVSGAESAMTVLPGGPIMATAMRTAAGHLNTGGGGGVGAAISGTGITSPTGTSTASTTPEGPTTSASSSSSSSLGTSMLNAVATGGTDGTGGIDSSLAQSQQQNLYYLQIQEQVNQQDRSFSTLSNVLKSEHDTMKNAIGNIH